MNAQNPPHPALTICACLSGVVVTTLFALSGVAKGPMLFVIYAATIFAATAAVIMRGGFASWRLRAAPAIPSVRDAGLALGALLAALVMYPFVEIAATAADIPMLWRPAALPTPQGNAVFLLYAIAVLALAPMAEEALLRDLLPDSLAPYMPGLAVLVSAKLFAIVHIPAFGPGFAAYMIIWSLIASLIRRLGGSLWPCMIFHVTNNAIAYFVLPAIITP